MMMRSKSLPLFMCDSSRQPLNPYARCSRASLIPASLARGDALECASNLTLDHISCDGAVGTDQFRRKHGAQQRTRTSGRGVEKAPSDARSQVNARQVFFKIPITDTKCWQKCHVLRHCRYASKFSVHVIERNRALDVARGVQNADLAGAGTCARFGVTGCLVLRFEHRLNARRFKNFL